MPYDFAAIRQLVLDAFTDEDLLRFCHDSPAFHAVCDRVSSSAALDNIADALITYAEKQGLVPTLLSEIAAANPRQFARFADRLGSETAASTPGLPVRPVLERVPTVAGLIDRTAELATYRRQLARQRLAIIKGLAGVGKTSLGAALALAEAGSEQPVFWFTFDDPGHGRGTANDEALFWALAAFLADRGDPRLWNCLAGEIAGERPMDPEIKLNLLFSGLAAGDYLLCFDDVQHMEQSPEAMHLLEHLRRGVRGRLQDLPARFIVIGREVPAGIEYLVPDALGGLTCDQAGTLLERQGVTLSPTLLRRLWEQTEGNPKLLELSAATLLGLVPDPAAMERYVGAMVRQGDVRDYILTEIYSELTAEDKRAAGVLSILSAPVDREEAENLLYAAGLADVAVRLERLAFKSILGESAEGRLHCHSLVRDYCYRVLDPGDRQRLHGQAAAYYEQAGRYVSAAHHALEAGATAQALDILAGHTRAILLAGESAGLLDQLSRCERRPLSVEQRAALSRARGEAQVMRGEYEPALAALQVALQGTAGSPARAALLHRIGTTYHKLGRYRLALRHLQDSLAISQAGGDQAGQAGTHYSLGWAYYALGQFAEARSHLLACQVLAAALGDRRLVAEADLPLGLLDWRAGQLDAARARFETCRDVFAAYGDRQSESEAIGNLGLIYGELGQVDRQLDYYRQALDVQEKMGDVYGMAVGYNNLADLYGRQGDHPQMLAYYTKLADLAADTGQKPMLSTAYAGLADATLALGDPHRALDYATRACQAVEEADPGVERGVGCRAQGEAWLALGDRAQAAACFEQAIPLLQQANEEVELARARRGLDRAAAHPGAGA